MFSLAFELGFDHYQYNLPLDILRFSDNHRQEVLHGYQAAQTLNISRRKPDRYDKKLMGLRDRALVKGLEITITVADLIYCFEKTKGICPITLVPFTFAENHSTDWSIDRVDNTRGYCPDNIVIISVVANQAKSDMDLPGIIKKGLQSPKVQDELTTAQWLSMARFYYPIMKIKRPLKLCLILTDCQQMYDNIVFTLLYKNESKNAKAILKQLNKYIAKDTLLKAAKLTKKRVYLRSLLTDDLLYSSPKLYGWVRSFIAAINDHSSDFDSLLVEYLFAPE